MERAAPGPSAAPDLGRRTARSSREEPEKRERRQKRVGALRRSLADPQRRVAWTGCTQSARERRDEQVEAGTEGPSTSTNGRQVDYSGTGNAGSWCGYAASVIMTAATAALRAGRRPDGRGSGRRTGDTSERFVVGEGQAATRAAGSDGEGPRRGADAGLSTADAGAAASTRVAAGGAGAVAGSTAAYCCVCGRACGLVWAYGSRAAHRHGRGSAEPADRRPRGQPVEPAAPLATGPTRR